MKLGRLWQPRHPLFWQMLAYNGLSWLCGWVLRERELSGAGTALFVLLALANVAAGAWCAWRLLRAPP